jgi:OFA family oxalate/formate antiporter-like MFS transporter
VGIAYGGAPALLSASTLGFFGPKHYAVNFATATFSLAPAAIIGPLIASNLQERAGGAYNTTFIMLIVVALIALVLNLFLGAFAKRKGME